MEWVQPRMSTAVSVVVLFDFVEVSLSRQMAA